MEMSGWGQRPSMDASIPGVGVEPTTLDRTGSGWSSCCPASKRGSDDDDDGSDDGMFDQPVGDALMNTTNTEGPVIESKMDMSQFANNTVTDLGSLGDDDDDGGGLFVPNEKFDIGGDACRIEMPDLSAKQLPIGTEVWVTDEMDVRMQLGDAFDGHIIPLCNGKKSGIIRRHQERLTLVEFYDRNNDVVFTYTFPRRCLSNESFESYESSGGENGCGGMSINVGGLAPRAAGGGGEKKKETITLLQQFCELVDVGSPTQMVEEGWGLFLKRKYADSITALDDIVDYAQTSNNTNLLVEAKTFRSFAHLYNGRPDLSLRDALASIDANPSWAQGYIRASRAYCAVGKLHTGIEMLNQAALFLPHSTSLKRSVNMLHHIKTLQRHLDRHHLQYVLDENYVKRLCTKRGFQPGDVIVSDEDIVVGAPSIENDGVCCEMCMGHGVGLRAGPVPSLSPATSNSAKGVGFYDCQRCQRRSGYFLSLELDRASRIFDFAFGMLQNKAAKTADILSIERARLAARLFYILFSKCIGTTPTSGGRGGSLSANADSMSTSSPLKRPPPVSDPSDLLPAMGLFPIPSSHTDQKTTDNLHSLHSMISGFMSHDEKLIFTKDLFVQLFVLVSQYAVHVEGISDHGSQAEALSKRLHAFSAPREGSLSSSSMMPTKRAVKFSGYVLPSVVGCVGRTEDAGKVNCRVQTESPGKIVLQATRTIASGERLYIAELRRGREVE